MGVELGKVISEGIGVSEMGLCKPGFEDFGMVAVLTGTDCNFSFDPSYSANVDVSSGRQFCEAFAAPSYDVLSAPGVCSDSLIWVYGDTNPPFVIGTFRMQEFTRISSREISYSYRLERSPYPFGASRTMAVVRARCIKTDGSSGLAPETVSGEMPLSPPGASQSSSIVRSYSIQRRCVSGHTIVLEAAYQHGPHAGNTAVVAGYDGGPPPEQVSDPERRLECRILASDSVTYSAFSAPYHETGGQLPNVVCPDLPEGVWPVTRSIWDTSVLGDKLLQESELTGEAQDWLTNTPECANGSCKLDLQIVTGTGVRTCFDDPGACQDWFDDPDRADKFQCHYAQQVVDLAECFIYSQVFKPQAVATGNPWADPTTGAPIGAPTSTPGGAYPGTVTNPDTAPRQCYPTGWGVLNPVEWVMKPVQCALEWAFVPRPSVVQATATSVRTAFDDTSIKQVTELAASIPAMMPAAGSDCNGPPVSFGPPLDQLGMAGTWYPLAACTEPMSTVAMIARISGVAFTGFGAVLAVINFFAGTIGFRGLGRRDDGGDS